MSSRYRLFPLVLVAAVAVAPKVAHAQADCPSPTHTVAQILAGGVFGQVTLVGEVIRDTGDADEKVFSDDGGVSEFVLDFPSGTAASVGLTIRATGTVASSDIDVTDWAECSLVPVEPVTWGRIKALYTDD